MRAGRWSAHHAVDRPPEAAPHRLLQQGLPVRGVHDSSTRSQGPPPSEHPPPKGISMSVTIDVIGVPAPQGSKTRMPNGAMVEASSTTGRQKLKSWRAAVTEAAVEAKSDITEPLTGPLTLHIDFRFPLPKGDQHRQRHIGKPDLSKLVRSTEDALVAAQLVRDDALFWREVVQKRYVQEGEPLGARIEIVSDAELELSFRQQSKARTVAARIEARAAAKRAS